MNIGDPDDLIPLGRSKPNLLRDWRDIQSLKLLNLTYDLIPVEFISMVITEVGDIPPTAVPAIVREYK
jgi:translation initiation factor eIF-2B subunit delta